MKNEFLIAVIISLILHILAIASLSGVQSFLSDHADAIEVFLLTPKGGWQIADVVSPLNEERPAKARFLGLRDQSVKEETVARLKTPSPLVGEGGGEGEKGKNFHLPLNPLPSLRLRSRQAREGKMASEDLLIEEGKKDSGDTAPLGSYASLPEDFYPDFRRGEHTYLNVLRYPDVEYFVRLKRIFKTTWDPVSAVRNNEMNVIARGTLQSVVAVALDKSGELQELFVINGSGLASYDDEALRTVRASSPFASPPEKFLDKDGVLRMSWTFTLYL